MDYLSVLIGSGLSFLGLGLGIWAERRKRNRLAQVHAPLKPICSCEHVLSMHKSNGKCNAEIKRWNDRYDYDEWKPCPCLRYIGPVPMNMGDLLIPPVFTEIPEGDSATGFNQLGTGS